MKNIKTLVLGSDHAGFELKEKVKEFIRANHPDLVVTDAGTHSSESTDYPDYAHKVATQVGNGITDLGILICGSGNGVCMAANRHRNVRAALCWTAELAELARLHNNANILCLPARFIPGELALHITEAFLNTTFEGGRHQRRVEKIEC